MATAQIDKPTESVEELLEKANRKALVGKKQLTAKASPAIDITDKVALRDLAMKELVAIVSANAGDIRGISAVKELLDRVEGKAAQSIVVDSRVNHVHHFESAKEREESRQEALEYLKAINADYVVIDGLITDESKR
jgi:hypothetical protein